MKVYSHKTGSLFYQLQNCMDCPCGSQNIKQYPCEHQLDAANALNVDYHRLFHEKFTSKHWMEQYLDITFHPVSTVDVWLTLPLSNHKIPNVFKKSKGRPKANKRIKSAIEMSIKKNRTDINGIDL